MIQRFTRFVGFLTAPGPARRIPDGKRLALALSFYIGAATAHGTDWQPLTAIEAAAEALVAGAADDATTVRADPLDPRLKLGRCAGPLEASLRNGARVSRRTVVTVRCPGAAPWKVYVPVDVVVTGEVYVVRRSLPRGHLLTLDDVERRTRDLSRVTGGYVTDPAALVGHELERALTAGSILTTTVLAVRDLIRRGQSVTLVARADGIAITMAGTALGDGALGQRIRVENAASRRVVEGLVRSAERVEVLLQ